MTSKSKYMYQFEYEGYKWFA